MVININLPLLTGTKNESTKSQEAAFPITHTGLDKTCLNPHFENVKVIEWRKASRHVKSLLLER